MIDNEQRAHGIALHAVDAKILSIINESMRNNSSYKFDYYAMYKNALEEITKSVTKDFPDSSSNQ